MNTNVMIFPDPAPEKTAGGIILTKQQKSKTGVIAGFGTSVEGVKVGDRVAYDGGGYEIEHEGKKAIIVPADYLQCILNPTE